MNRVNLISEDIIKKLYDDKLVRRYGTSLSVNMGQNYKEYLEKKYVSLEKEFKSIDKDSNDSIDIEELKKFCDKYQNETGITLPNNYFRKLMELIDLNNDESVSIKEFVFNYLLLEEKLKLKRLKLEKLLEEIEENSSKIVQKCNEHKNEELNENGIAHDANLNILLLEARELKPLDYDGTSDPYCIFSMGDQEVKSSYKESTLNPVWNEEFDL
jgi:Ca2+-binding EF-hand superfamily protein